jgi:5'-nucleotidase
VIQDNLGEIAATQVAALRGAGADVVILLSHLGSYLDKMIGANVPGIDFIIGGHDHYLFTEPISVTNPLGTQTLIFQAGDFYRYVGKLRITVESGSVTSTSYELLPVDASVPPEPTVAGVVSALKDGIVATWGDVYHTALGTAAHDMVDTFNPNLPLRDTPMGNFITDAFRWKTGTNVAITALGLTSERFYAGPITGADVFRAVPYGFDEETGLGLKLATFDITGAELVKGLEIGLSQLEITDDYFLQVSGMRFTYDPAQPVGQRVNIKSIRIDGKKFSPAATYSVTVNTGLVMLLGTLGLEVQNLNLMPDLEFAVISDYITKIGSLNYHSQGRIREQRADAIVGTLGSVAKHFGNLSSNYPNPFNPSTTISISLPQSSVVRLRIYNMLGQEVATLLNGEMSAGHHDVVWNAGDAASGMYYYCLEAGSVRETKKMLLLK